MSEEVFPDLPGLKIGIKRKQINKTTVLTAASGVEYRARWWVTPKYKYVLEFDFLRNKLDIGLEEVNILTSFIERHSGQFDSFYYNDPIDQTTKRVRFASDEFEIQQLVTNIWQAKSIEMITVI